MGDAFVTVVFVFYRKSKVLILTGETSVCGMKTETAAVQVLQFCDPCPLHCSAAAAASAPPLVWQSHTSGLRQKKNKHNKHP